MYIIIYDIIYNRHHTDSLLTQYSPVRILSSSSSPISPSSLPSSPSSYYFLNNIFTSPTLLVILWTIMLIGDSIAETIIDGK